MSNLRRKLSPFDFTARRCIAGLSNRPMAVRRNIARALQDLQDEYELKMEAYIEEAEGLRAQIQFKDFLVAEANANLKQLEASCQTVVIGEK